MSAQEQFLNVIDRDEAERRFRAALRLGPLGEEKVPLTEGLGRVLSRDVAAAVDVPAFDRSNFDGFAVRAADTVGAEEEQPRVLELLEEALATGVVPRDELRPGTAMTIATGAMLPRGADAVVMVEHTECGVPLPREPSLQPSPGGRGRGRRKLTVYKAVTPGLGVSFAGTDISAGEIVLRRGELLTSRETGVLAAIGADRVSVWRRPRVAILSTGDELLEPGQPMRPAMIYDSNAQILADAVREAGGDPLRLGIVDDDLEQLRTKLQAALEQADIVLLSGGTSKGEGDLCYRAVGELAEPGIVAHGVALKPGKPICLAVTHGKPVVVLPGFPTSAIFTFHEFVAPVIRIFGGRPAEERTVLHARLAVKVNSEIGRTEYLLVGLVEGEEKCSVFSVQCSEGRRQEADGRRQEAAACVEASARRALAADGRRQEADDRRQTADGRQGELVAYPMGKGSGSVTAFSRADGFITIGRHEEIVEAGTVVDVQLLGRELRLADLVVIGSHCVGLDYLLSRLQECGYKTKFLAVGSTAGLHAARRGECDVAGIHLLDPKTGTYNAPFLTPDLELIPGYSRRQGLLFRRSDARFEGQTVDALFGRSYTSLPPASCRLPQCHVGLTPRRTPLPRAILSLPHCVMVNRNQGSGTRILIDRLLGGAQPPGYAVQAKNHNAVAAAVAQGRADWGIAIEHVARHAGLGFLPIQDEQYDFVIPRARLSRAAVVAFQKLLAEQEIRAGLMELGLR